MGHGNLVVLHPFTSDPPITTHFMDIRSFKIFTGEWVQLKHASVMKCHNYSLLHTNRRFSHTYCTLSHSEFYTNISSSDWPVYEVIHASSCIRKWLIYQGEYFFLVFTVGVLLLSHTYLHGENNSLQSAFYNDWTKTWLWLGSGKHYIFLPFFQACLTNLCLFRCGFKNFFPYRKSGVKVVY